MKRKYINLTTLVVFLITLTSLVMIYRPTNVLAQIDAFTFFIPYPADLFDDQLQLGALPIPPDYLNQDIETIVSLVAARDGTIIYYDHWEDGYEPILTSPTQPTTEIWGDGDLTNGAAPGIPADLIDATNRVITAQSIVTINPRDPSNIFYDGGDKLTAVGGNIAVSLSEWRDAKPGNVFGDIFYTGAWELYATERWGTNYIVPAGNGPPSNDISALRNGFTVTLINVQAAQDGTNVTIDLDSDGTTDVTQTLNEGESFVQTTGTASTGATVQASAPVQVHLFTSDPTATYEARGYTLVPRPQWSDDYIAPRSSDGDFLLYNPDTTDLTVQVLTQTNVASFITIPAQSTILFPDSGLPDTAPDGANIALSPATGTRFTSTDGRPFYGMAALNADSAQDWGYSLIPLRNLTTQYLIGWAPANCNQAGVNVCVPGAPAGNGDESQLYVSAATTTTIVIDYQNDGLITDTFVISRNAEVAIIDPNDANLTGAYLYSLDNTPFAIVWGQDQTANPGQPSLDMGTAIVPLASININKSIVLLDDADGSGTPTWGDTIRFDLFVSNNSNSDLSPTVIEDTIEPEISYVVNTTTVNGIMQADSGATPFPLDEGGLPIPLGPNQTSTISFQATINPNVNSVQNTACANAPGGLSACDTAEIPTIQTAAFELDKQVINPADGVAQRGDLVTYQITITSTGNISITTLPLTDTYDASQMTFVDATPTEDSNDPVAGTTTWNDLTTNFGPFDPGDVFSVTVRMRVRDDVPDPGATIPNTACVTGILGADGNTPQGEPCDTAEITVPPLAAAYIFDKRLIAPANGQSNAGQTVTFGLSITSTGNLTITAMTLTDRVNPAHLTFANSDPIPTSNDLTAGTTAWDIVDKFGQMTPGKTVNLTVTYTVANPLPGGVLNTTNTATVDGVRDANGGTLPPQTDTATVNFPTPTPTPDTSSDDDDGGPPPPTPTPTPDPNQPVAFAPPGAPVPGATPTLPVNLLPETGNQDGQAGTRLTGLFLLVVVVSGAIFFIWSKLTGAKQSVDS